MKKREYGDYLNDIFQSIEDAASFVKGMTFREFVLDRKTVNAVVRSIEIIGEASGRIPKHIRDKAPDVPWAEIRGMRNKMAHEYFGIDNKIVWDTVKRDLPRLRPQIKKLLRQTLDKSP